MVSFTNPPLHPLGKIPNNCVGLRAGLDDLDNTKISCPCRKWITVWSSNPRPRHFTGYTILAPYFYEDKIRTYKDMHVLQLEVGTFLYDHKRHPCKCCILVPRQKSLFQLNDEVKTQNVETAALWDLKRWWKGSSVFKTLLSAYQTTQHHISHNRNFVIRHSEKVKAQIITLPNAKLRDVDRSSLLLEQRSRLHRDGRDNAYI